MIPTFSWPSIPHLGLSAQPFVTKSDFAGPLYRNLHFKKKMPSIWSSGSNVLSLHALDMVTAIAELCSFVCVCPGTPSDCLVTVQVSSCTSASNAHPEFMVPSGKHHPSPRGPSEWHCHTSCGMLRVPAAGDSGWLRAGEQVPVTTCLPE